MKHLIGDGTHWSLRDFKNNKEERLLITDPDWQRNEVWSTKKRSALIDSILMKVPIPYIYLSKNIDEDKNTTYEVIDGKQRIESVIAYLNDKFAISNSDEIYNDEIKNKKFSKLPEHLQNNLRNAKLNCFELTNPDKDLLHETFKRINTKGESLNTMEVRNGIYPGPLTNLIRDLADDERFNKLLPYNLLNEKKEFKKRMKDRNCVLRFLAFYAKGWDTEGVSLKKFLDNFYEDHKKKGLSEEEASDYTQAFHKALEACEVVFGKTPFRLNKEGKDINLGFFQYITACFKNYSLDQIKQKSDAIREAHKTLMKQPTHQVNPEKDTIKTWAEIISASNATDIRYAFNTWKEKLKEVMKDTPLR